MTTLKNAAIAMVMMLAGSAGLVADDGNNKNQEVRLRTKLAGSAIAGKTPAGSADFRMDQQGRVRLNVEVEHVNLPAGTMLTVSITHGAAVTSVGTITLSALGEGELELSTEHGGIVPAVQKGDMVTVSNGATAILAGVF